MGIGFVLIFWAIFGSIGAVIGSLVLRKLVSYLTRQERESSRSLLRFAITLPFLCLAWAGIVFVFQATVNVAAFHRDIGLGDVFECPLPNGYALSFIDTTEIGTVHKQSVDAGVENVRLLQLADPYMVTASDSKAFDHFGQKTAFVDTFSLIDIRTGHQTDFSDMRAIQQEAKKLHFAINLLPIGNFYSKFRFTWFDIFAIILLIVPPILGVLCLVLSTLRIRQSA